MRRDAGDASELDVQLAAVNAGQIANAAAQDSVSAITAVLDVQRAMGLAADTVTIALADTLDLPAADTALTTATTLAGRGGARRRCGRPTPPSRWLGAASCLAPSLTVGFDTHDPTQRGLLPAIGIAIPLPLFNFNGGQIAAAAAERDRARGGAGAGTPRERRGRWPARGATSPSRSRRRRRDRGLVTSAERVAAMSLTAYAEGAVGLPSVLEAQRQARDALALLIDDLAAANTADAAVRLFTATEASP